CPPPHGNESPSPQASLRACGVAFACCFALACGRASAKQQATTVPLLLMPRFVILEHDHPTRHWDLMLEARGVLRTWRLSAPPKAGVAIAATASFDHRAIYLDYEGP